jgi:L-amino acid N-acyltransferase YncA
MAGALQPVSAADLGLFRLLRRFRELGAGIVVAKMRRRLWSTHTAIGVVRDLESASYLAPDGMQVEVVQPEAFDALPLLVEAASGVEYLYVRPIERTRRARAGTISVARDAAGELMAFHFIHAAGDRDALEQVAPKMYPALAADEVLTEAVYCLPAFRGRDTMSALLRATGSLLATRGTRRAFAYLDTKNVASLRMFSRAGYRPSGVERVDRFRLFRFSTVFRDLTPITRTSWETSTRGATEEIVGDSEP